MKTTKRQFLKQGISLAGILATCQSPAILTKSILAQRSNSIFLEDDIQYSASDYAQDGLIAFWDAEWNIGDGLHEDNPIVWKNLADNGLDMVSNGNPIFYSNYIQPTQYDEMWHTSETNLMDDFLQTGKISIEVVGECVVGKTQPKMCLFGGGQLSETTWVSFSCIDATRIGFSARIGSATVLNYDKHNAYGKVSLYSNGETMQARYYSSSGIFSRNASLTSLPLYRTKIFTIGYRSTYYKDGPMTNGEKVYSIRVYDHALTEQEKLNNDAIDLARFKF